MNPFEFVIIIIALAFLSDAVKSYFKSKNDKREAERREDDEASEYAERLRQLEERIRVLERIVTDEQFELKQRFRNL
ncbi:MAG: hypothetical protein JXB36_04035 [Gammaproteobacteria bacterium]|nr:hypothetical protein [Gammaproteobacteria bacterium]